MVGWGNNELQDYTGAGGGNAYIESGNLVIEAIHNAGAYTSARVHTHGKQSFRYGILVARIRQPSDSLGRSDLGTWSAFWTLGDNFSGWNHDVDYGGDTVWPRSGEIDIMERFVRSGSVFIPNETHGANHWHVDNVAEQCQFNSFSSNHCSTEASYISPQNIYATYHLYGVEWTDSQIRWFVNNEIIQTLDITDEQFNPFRLPHFILLNLAVGGNISSTPDATHYPQKMYIDWVRHYQCPAGSDCNLSFDSITPVFCPHSDHIADGSYVIYSDCVGTNLPAEFSHYLGFEYTIDGGPAAGSGFDGAEGTVAYLELTGNAAQPWAAGGWARNNTTSTVDLSSYGALHVSVRSTSTSVNSVTLKMEDSSQASGIGKEISQTFTANSGWQNLCVPLSQFTTGENAVDLSIISAPFVYVLSANDVSIDIDEIYFSTSSSCS